MKKPALTVWYNTRCPVCDSGIRAQQVRLLDLVKTGEVSFCDINIEHKALARYGASLDDVRRRLHATDADGRLVTGADVMLALWRMTPGQRWLATMLGNPTMLPLTRRAYDRFADLLYAWNRRKGHW